MKINEINSLKEYGFSCIYLWINIENGKKYVGQARNFYNRMSQYKKGKFNKHMKSAILKYGIENFDILILEKDVVQEELNNREQYWMDYFKSYEQQNGYNIVKCAGNTFGYRHTEESKYLMSEIAKHRFKDPLELLKVTGENNGMYGKKHEEEWKINHSECVKNLWKDEGYRKAQTSRMIGENNPMFGVRLVGDKNGMYGKTQSEETKAKIREKRKGSKGYNARGVMCLETKEEFYSMTEASIKYNTTPSAIKRCCDNEKYTCRKNHWIYL